MAASQLEGDFFRRAFQVAQLTSVKSIFALAFGQEAGGMDFARGHAIWHQASRYFSCLKWRVP
jgi:hypothetical protein